MSLAPVPMATQAVVNSLMTFQDPSTAYAIDVGPTDYTPMRIVTATVANANSPVQFVVTPPQWTTVIDPNMMIKWTITATATCRADQIDGFIRAVANPAADTNCINSPLSLGTDTCLRFAPVTSCIQSTTVTINNTSVTIQQSDTFPLVQRYLDTSFLYTNYSNMPCMLDPYQHPSSGRNGGYPKTQNFLDANGAPIPITPPSTNGVPQPAFNVGYSLGNVIDPVNTYGNSMGPFIPPRGSFPWISNTIQLPAGGGNIVAATMVTQTVTWESVEPFFLPPFDASQYKGGLVGVTQMNITINLGDLRRCLYSRLPNVQQGAAAGFNYVPNRFNPAWIPTGGAAGDNAGAGLTVTITANPELLVNYLTLNPMVRIPENIMYPYADLRPYITNIGETVNPQLDGTNGKVYQVTSQNTTIPFVPARIYLAVGRNNGAKNVCTTDTFLTITGVTVLWDNRSGLLSQANRQQLHIQSVQSGSNIGAQEWFFGCGSVFCIDFTKNIGLPQISDAPGTPGNRVISVLVNYQNNSPYTFPVNTLQLTMVVVSSGVMTIKTGAAYLSDSPVAASDVTDALASLSMDPTRDTPGMVANPYGGGIFGKVGKVFGNAAKKVAGKVAKTAIRHVTGGRMGRGPVGGSLFANPGLFGGKGFGGEDAVDDDDDDDGMDFQPIGGRLVSTSVLAKRAAEDEDEEAQAIAYGPPKRPHQTSKTVL